VLPAWLATPQRQPTGRSRAPWSTPPGAIATRQRRDFLSTLRAMMLRVALADHEIAAAADEPRVPTPMGV